MPLSKNYTTDIPQGYQQINNTQQPIEDNFQAISELMEVNHIPFNMANTFGTHTYLDYILQTNIPPGTSSTDLALYSQLSSNNTQQLYMQYQNNGSTSQLTPFSNSSFSYGIIDTHIIENGPDTWSRGCWIRFQNGLLMMTFGGASPLPNSTSQYVANFPNGEGIPTYTKTPFNLIFNQSNITYQNKGYPIVSLVTPTSPTTYTEYFNGQVPSTGQVTTPTITVLGV